jgi:hypothetical protein
MNTLLITLGLLHSLTLTASETNSVTWLQGPFWRGPQVLELNKKLDIVDPDLKRSCETYSKSIDLYKNDPVDEILASRIERYRKQVLITPFQKSFRGRFQILDVSPTTNFEIPADESLQIVIGEKADSLPMYTQPKTITGGYIKDAKEFAISAQEDSYTVFSRKLGLKDSSVIITYDQSGRTIIEVNNRDLACDLLYRKAIITAKVPTYVGLTKAASSEMSNFYAIKLSPKIDKTLSKTSDSLNIKAAKLGYRFGLLLEDLNHNNDLETNELQVGGLMNLLFNSKTMEPNELLIKFNDKKTVDFRSSITGLPITLSLGM